MTSLAAGEDGPDARGAEERAAGEARALLTQAVAAYERSWAAPPDAEAEAGARGNCGNALCALAGGPLAPPAAEQLAPLERAAELYRAALALDPDAGTAANLGDCLVQAGEALCELGRGADGARAFAEAREAFARACSISDSERGDDLPSLLHNWGAGLHAMALRAPSPAERRALLEEARGRLADAAAFNRGDAEALNALGDLYVLAAEEAEGDGATGLLRRALEEGYEAALRIDAGNADALVGRAEVGVLAGRRALAAGRVDAARAQFAGAAASYRAALARRDRLGDFSERSSVKYNAACAACLAGEADAAAGLLLETLRQGGTDPGEVLADADLAPLVGHPLLREALGPG